jgi:hypothetical protein
MTKFILISLLTTAALSAPVSPSTDAAPFGPIGPSVAVQPQEMPPHLTLLRGSGDENDASNPFDFDKQTHRMIQGKRNPSNLTLAGTTKAPSSSPLSPSASPSTFSNLVRVSTTLEVPVEQAENLVRVLDIIELAIAESYLLSRTKRATHLDQEPVVEQVSKYISSIREYVIYREVDGTEINIPFALKQIQIGSTSYVDSVLNERGIGKKNVFKNDLEVITKAVAMLERVTGPEGTWEFDEVELAALSGVSQLLTTTVFALMGFTAAVLMN